MDAVAVVGPAMVDLVVGPRSHTSVAEPRSVAAESAASAAAVVVQPAPLLLLHRDVSRQGCGRLQRQSLLSLSLSLARGEATIHQQVARRSDRRARGHHQHRVHQPRVLSSVDTSTSIRTSAACRWTHSVELVLLVSRITVAAESRLDVFFALVWLHVARAFDVCRDRVCCEESRCVVGEREMEVQ